MGKGINYVLIGNPGVGKSTVLNGFVGKVVFPNGPSYGQGMTKELNETQVGDDWFLDTPGLADVTLRKAAAAAITAAMKKGGQFKIIFIIQLIEGRMRPEDITTMKLVLDSAPIPDYGIIFNKLEDEHYDALTKNENNAYDLVIGSMADVSPKTVYHHFMKRQSRIAGKKNVVPEIDTEMKNFILRVPLVCIDSSQVKEISLDKFEKMMEMLENKLHELGEDNKKLVKAIEDQKKEYQQKFKEQEERERKLREQLDAATTAPPAKKQKTGLEQAIDFGAGLLNSFIPGAGLAAKGLMNVFGL